MYNKDRKKQFLETLKDKAETGRANRVFVASEEPEILTGKDLCEFDREELLDLIEQMEIVQLTTAQGCYTVIRKYMKWCMDAFLIPATDLVQISVNEMQKRLTALPEIITYEELQKNERRLINICDRLILEAIYLGIKGKDYCELFSMSEKDIDRKRKTLRLCTGREIKVTSNFIDLCESSAECYEYELVSGQKQKLVGNLPIKRNAQADKASGKTRNADIIASRLKRFKKLPGYKDNLSTTMLFDSGFVNACKSAMKENEVDDFEYFMKTEKGKEIYSQYGLPQTQTAKWNKMRKYKGYFE